MDLEGEKAMPYGEFPSQEIQKEIASRLAADADFMQLHGLLGQYKKIGATAEEVAHELEQLRSFAAIESDEDKILELLDVVRGFCSPHLKIW